MSSPTARDQPEARAVIARYEAKARREEVLHRGLLHGGHGSWLHWIRNIDALSREHALWLPDMPSYGDSDSLEGHPHAADRMPRFVDAISSTMDGLLGARTAIDLAGFSFGGITAAFLAARRGHIRRLALLGAGPGGKPSTSSTGGYRIAPRCSTRFAGTSFRSCCTTSVMWMRLRWRYTNGRACKRAFAARLSHRQADWRMHWTPLRRRCF
jgi:pimeloyl-ACP methyl ester carboxylesterase